MKSTFKSSGDGVCRCGNFGSLYRGGICYDCTKRLTGSAQELMKGNPNYTKMRLAINRKKFLTDIDNVREVA